MLSCEYPFLWGHLPASRAHGVITILLSASARGTAKHCFGALSRSILRGGMGFLKRNSTHNPRATLYCRAVARRPLPSTVGASVRTANIMVPYRYCSYSIKCTSKSNGFHYPGCYSGVCLEETLGSWYLRLPSKSLQHSLTM